MVDKSENEVEKTVGSVGRPSIEERLRRVEVAVRAGLVGTIAFMVLTCIGIEHSVIARMSLRDQRLAGALVFIMGVASIGSWYWAFRSMRHRKGER